VKVLFSWLREFVEVPGSAEQVAATMSVRGFAVEGIERIGEERVLDFEVTANRPDCMSVLGIAREVATAYGLPFRDGGTADADGSGAAAGVERARRRGNGGAGPAEGRPADPGIEVTIDSPELCARYAGALADVTVGASPEWMQARLRASGLRPISNIVDITNYVLLERGQPMHAFDLTRLQGAQIRVRTARRGEHIRTLDGQMRELSPDMLVIADAKTPVAVAGVMGGADSEVNDSTTTIVFESAYFDPLSVRRTSRTLGLKTEASIRFERGTDPHLPVTAMRRALELLEQIGAGRARGPIVDRRRVPFGIDPLALLLRRARVLGLLGATIADADVERILSALGFSLARVEEGWRVSIPTRRVDVKREVDLIEEVARQHGFDRIPSTFPALTSAPAPMDPRITRARQLRAVMTGAGFSEAVTFGFIGERQAAAFASEGEVVAIANPLSENFAVLRPSALPALVGAVAHNRRREQRDVRLFEIGTRFSRSAGERRALACAWTGSIGADHWSGGAREADFFDMKGVVERIGEAFRVAIRTDTHREPWLVPGRTASIVARLRASRYGKAGTDVRIGVLGQLMPAIAEEQGLPQGDTVYVAEIDLDAAEQIAAQSEIQVEPLPRYPSVTRDISILVDDTLPAATVRTTIRDAAPDTLVRVREFDRYQGKGVPDGKISLSLRLTFRSPERTLTDADVQSAMDGVLTALREKHGAVQR
jgi:phenylalanyl-tRNA synthetase beta chain